MFFFEVNGAMRIGMALSAGNAARPGMCNSCSHCHPFPPAAPMRISLQTGLLAIVLTVLAPLADGHEFWLEAQPFTVETGASTAISLRVGENFDGELTPLVDERTAALRHYSAGSVVDLMPRLPHRTALPRLEVPINSAGLHLIAFDSQPITFSLP